MRAKTTGAFGWRSLLLVVMSAVGLPGAVTLATPAVSDAHAPRVQVPGPPANPNTIVCNQPWLASNWSGYALNCATFTSVSGTWTVPTVEHSEKKSRYSATWVGIDGFNQNDGNLIQAGTEQDWNHGVASYGAWWEVLPAYETPITSITVHPGDVMTVSIVKGSPDWTITVTDITTDRSFSTQQSFSGDGESAEWIQEAPTVNGAIARLAHDSTFAFSDATANGVNPGFTTDNVGRMVQRRKVVSTPSAPNAGQNGFAVAYGKVAPPPPG